jgi:hypothetical protein
MGRETLSAKLRQLATLDDIHDHRGELESAAYDAEMLEAEVRHLRAVLDGNAADRREHSGQPRLVGPEVEERCGGVPGLEADD